MEGFCKKNWIKSENDIIFRPRMVDMKWPRAQNLKYYINSHHHSNFVEKSKKLWKICGILFEIRKIYGFSEIVL